MIDLDRIEAGCDALINQGFGWSSPAYSSASSVKELITRLRQAEKDAARYRCIKALAKSIECEEFDIDMLDGQDLDAMIDECIEAMNGSGN